MAFCIAAESCAACGDCRNACPVDDAIIVGQVYRIDPEACTDCGICVDICLTASIYAPRPNGADSAHHEFL